MATLKPCEKVGLRGKKTLYLIFVAIIIFLCLRWCKELLIEDFWVKPAAKSLCPGKAAPFRANTNHFSLQYRCTWCFQPSKFPTYWTLSQLRLQDMGRVLVQQSRTPFHQCLLTLARACLSYDKSVKKQSTHHTVKISHQFPNTVGSDCPCSASQGTQGTVFTKHFATI